MTYCTDAQVAAYLPDGLPTDVDTSGERATYLSQGSALAEGYVGERFALGSFSGATQKFPEVTGTPSTPMVVQIAAAKFAAAILLRHIGFASNFGRSSVVADADKLEEEAKAMCAEMRDGFVDVIDSAGTRYGDVGVAGTATTSEPVFSVGRYDADGELVSEESGSTDGFIA